MMKTEYKKYIPLIPPTEFRRSEVAQEESDIEDAVSDIPEKVKFVYCKVCGTRSNIDTAGLKGWEWIHRDPKQSYCPDHLPFYRNTCYTCGVRGDNIDGFKWAYPDGFHHRTLCLECYESYIDELERKKRTKRVRA